MKEDIIQSRTYENKVIQKFVNRLLNPPPVFLLNTCRAFSSDMACAQFARTVMADLLHVIQSIFRDFRQRLSRWSVLLQLLASSLTFSSVSWLNKTQHKLGLCFIVCIFSNGVFHFYRGKGFDHMRSNSSWRWIYNSLRRLGPLEVYKPF